MWQRVIGIFIVFISPLNYAIDTEIKLYRPFGDVIEQKPLIVKKTYPGECWQQSQRIKREDAWQCVVKNKNYDPCFIKSASSHKQAICPHSPWDGTSILLNLSKAVDSSEHSPLDVSTTYPWAIELQDGEKCLAIAKGGFHDKMPIRYDCDNQTQLIGHLQRCKASWTMLQHSHDNSIKTVIITKAWF